jgi:hypothetical protein
MRPFEGMPMLQTRTLKKKAPQPMRREELKRTAGPNQQSFAAAGTIEEQLEVKEDSEMTERSEFNAILCHAGEFSKNAP